MTPLNWKRELWLWGQSTSGSEFLIEIILLLHIYAERMNWSSLSGCVSKCKCRIDCIGVSKCVKFSHNEQRVTAFEAPEEFAFTILGVLQGDCFRNQEASVNCPPQFAKLPTGIVLEQLKNAFWIPAFNLIVSKNMQRCAVNSCCQPKTPSISLCIAEIKCEWM